MSAAVMPEAQVDVLVDIRHRARRRTLVANGVLVVILLAVVVGSIGTGAYALSPGHVLRTLAGQGDAMDHFVVFELRLPGILVGILVGAAFAVSGSLFQVLLNNPLASPDIIGISGGASAAAVYAIVVLGWSGVSVSIAAFIGATLVATAIYLLASSGGMNGYRFVLIGVGFAFLANSVIGYVLTRGQVEQAQSALVWMVGSIDGVTMADVRVLAVTVLPLLLALSVVAPRLRIIQLGHDLASSLGVAPERTTRVALLLAAALIALATAIVGPIAFLAFVCGPIARRLLPANGAALSTAALVGPVVVLVADFVAQHLVPQTVQAPVGVITGILGGFYLMWLLSTSHRLRKRS